MDDEEEARLAAEAEEIATRTGDLHSLAMLKMRDRGPPRAGPRTPTSWIAAAEEAIALADESGDLHLRVAIRAAGAYAYLCAGDFDGFERDARRDAGADRRRPHASAPGS